MFSEQANTSLPAPPTEPVSPRDQAISRSLEAPHARSVERLERFLAAARDLANEQGSASFTVAQVTRQAGLSLKSFYRCFGGKDDLLVALLEEDSRLGAAILAEQVAAHADPAERVRAYLVGVFGPAVIEVTLARIRGARIRGIGSALIEHLRPYLMFPRSDHPSTRSGAGS